MDISVTIGNKTLPNPIGVASGTFGYGMEYEDIMDLGKIGAIYTKAVTITPRLGNPTPRLVETPGGMLNSIGLANVGVDRFITEKMPYLKNLKSAIVSNVAGSTEEEYQEVLEKLETIDEGLWGHEINISCPNVKHGGLAFGTDPVQVEKLTKILRKITDKPLIIKLTPNVTDIATIAKAAENGGADGISCINTVRGMIIDINKKKAAIPAKIAGLSGPAVLPIGIAATYMVANAVSIPVIGMGGIMCAEDAIQYLLAGASAIQIGTANFIDTTIPESTLAGIQDYMKNQGFTSIKDFHGHI